jgi:hypothetical protein
LFCDAWRRQDASASAKAVQAWETLFPRLQAAEAEGYFNYILTAVKAVVFVKLSQSLRATFNDRRSLFLIKLRSQSNGGLLARQLNA